mgnify:CR=1 FL=1
MKDILKNSQAGMETRVLMGRKKSENPFESERVLFFIFALHKNFLKKNEIIVHTSTNTNL